jgi:hypothetical protein
MQRDETRLHDIQIDGAGKAYGFDEPRFRRTRIGGSARAAAHGGTLEPRLDDNGTAALPTWWRQEIRALIATALFQLRA